MQCRNVVLLNGFAIIWNSVEIACGDAVIGNAQGKGEKRKICAQKWMKKKTDGMSSSAIIPHGCQFHADTFQQCVTIHTCIVVNSYKSNKKKQIPNKL